MPLLDEEQIRERLEQLDGWDKADKAIRKRFRFDDFKGSVEFVNHLTPEAEAMNHHPDLQISWNEVTVSISTHSQGGLTENDFELAKRVDAVA
jgi:4a-hydroxytetrahydrobiopterin dehydratase